MFKPTTLRVYLQRALENGFDPDEILDGSGTDWTDIEALRPLDLDEIGDLFGHFSRRTASDFAIRCGASCKIKDFGLVGFAMMSMPTLRDAFTYYTRHALLVGHPLVSTVSEQNSEWRLTYVPRRLMSPEAMRFSVEASIAAIEPVIEELTGERARTRRIEFAFDGWETDERYSLFPTGAVTFDQNASAYVGHRQDLDRPIRSRDGDLCDIFREKSDKALTRLYHEQSMRERIEDIMILSPGHLRSLDEMAEALGVSRRSLQRDLRSEYVSYQEIVKAFRMRHAISLLEDGHVNIKTIAHLLGFKDVGSFRRAFAEWTGKSAGRWHAMRDRTSISDGPRRSAANDRTGSFL
jgi:AraC-like DNA-binding protein